MTDTYSSSFILYLLMECALPRRLYLAGYGCGYPQVAGVDRMLYVQGSNSLQAEVSMIYKIVVTQFSKMLTNLLAILSEAEKYACEKKFETGVLLQARLAPDQFNLMRQIQTACDTAKLGAARLAGTDKDAPTHADKEATMGEIRARIESVIAYLGSFKPDAFGDAAARRITQPRWNGKSLLGEEFLLQHVIPNFYFHVAAAYAILRHNGVPVGKKNYLGDMPYRDPA